MSKESYYFSHDSNARNDGKILAVRMKHGAEGYGIYFMIVERLREETNNMSIKDYNVLAFDFRVGADKVKSIVEDFGLFEFSDCGKFFFSKRMIENMKRKNEKSEKAKLAANARWERDVGHKDANAMQTQCERNALKERKGKEKKEKEINISFDDFWDLYDKKVGSKEKMENKWLSLTDEVRFQIMEYIPKYKLSQPDKKYRKNPETFFNNKSWEDEVMISDVSVTKSKLAVL